MTAPLNGQNWVTCELLLPFSGLAPSFAGLYQVNAVVPAGVTPGNDVPVVLSVSGQDNPPR